MVVSQRLQYALVRTRWGQMPLGAAGARVGSRPWAQARRTHSLRVTSSEWAALTHAAIVSSSTLRFTRLMATILCGTYGTYGHGSTTYVRYVPSPLDLST